LGCGDLDLSLELANGARDASRIGVAAPCNDLRVLIRLTRHALEARPLAAPAAGVRVATRASPLRRDQLDLFRPAGPAPAVLGETLAALQSLCGDAHVGAPVAVDSHHPDSFALAPFAPSAPQGALEREPGPSDGLRSPSARCARLAGKLALRA